MVSIDSLVIVVYRNDVEEDPWLCNIQQVKVVRDTKS